MHLWLPVNFHLRPSWNSLLPTKPHSHCLYHGQLPAANTHKSQQITNVIHNLETPGLNSQTITALLCHDRQTEETCLFLRQGWGRANKHFPSLLCVSGIIYPLGSTAFRTLKNSSGIWRRFCLRQHSLIVDILRLYAILYANSISRWLLFWFSCKWQYTNVQILFYLYLFRNGSDINNKVISTLTFA